MKRFFAAALPSVVLLGASGGQAQPQSGLGVYDRLVGSYWVSYELKTPQYLLFKRTGANAIEAHTCVGNCPNLQGQYVYRIERLPDGRLKRTPLRGYEAADIMTGTIGRDGSVIWVRTHPRSDTRNDVYLDQQGLHHRLFYGKNSTGSWEPIAMAPADFATATHAQVTGGSPAASNAVGPSVDGFNCYGERGGDPSWIVRFTAGREFQTARPHYDKWIDECGLETSPNGVVHRCQFSGSRVRYSRIVRGEEIQGSTFDATNLVFVKTYRQAHPLTFRCVRGRVPVLNGSKPAD